MVTTTDKESQRIESMPESQVLKEIMQVLGRMFPSQHIEAPTDILIPRWHQHPLFRGSYSNWPIGALKKHHHNMRAPLNNRLWFAGEAMSAEHYGFLHGAWFEGNSVADSISRCIFDSCPYYEKHKYVTGCDQKPKFFRQF
jgi:polyamine oxidase